MTSLPILTLTTDFGLADSYVSAMKGVALSILPEVALIDITHVIPAQDIGRAAYVLAAACPNFPAHTVHLAVVDPGVGTARKPIAISTPHGTFVGPDNGVFHTVLSDQGVIDTVTGALIAGHAVELSDPRYRRQDVSTTFHGRDIFAPAAAYLAMGVPLSEFGPRLEALVPLNLPSPLVENGIVRGCIRYIDNFGNAVTDIRQDYLPPAPIILSRGVRINGLSSDYQRREITALVGSTGYLEIAVRNGSAHDRLGLNVGDEVMVRGED